MACQNLHENNRLWFYIIVMIICCLIAVILLMSSSKFDEDWKNYNLRKIFLEIGYTFVGTTIFTIIAILYEIFKDEDPEILSIINALNKGSSSNRTIHNDLPSSQPSRSIEVVRTMRENVRKKALERIRLRTLHTETGANTSSLEHNHLNQVPQVSGNLALELNATVASELSPQSSEISNDPVRAEDASSIRVDDTATSTNPFITDTSETTMIKSTVQHPIFEMADLRVMEEPSRSPESGTSEDVTSLDVLDLTTTAAMLFKSSPINALNISDVESPSFHNCVPSSVTTRIDFRVCPNGNRHCRHYRLPRM